MNDTYIGHIFDCLKTVYISLKNVDNRMWSSKEVFFKIVLILLNN